MSRLQSTVDFAKAVGRRVADDDVPSMAGSIAYFAILSLPPLLAVVVAVAGFFFSPEAIRGALAGEMGDLLGHEGAEQLMTMLEQARDIGGGPLLAQLLGGAALVLGATGAFAFLQKALNRAWDVEPDPERSGIRVFLLKRVMSFGMILAVAFLLAVSLVLSAVVRALSQQLTEVVGEFGWLLLQLADIVLPLLLFTLLFAAMFKVLPDAAVTWRVVWVGAVFTAVLFIVGRYLISLYLATAEVGEAFGAAGSLVIVLVWIYFTALLLLVGAEFTQVWALRYGVDIRPSEGAVRVVTEHRIERDEERRPVEAREPAEAEVREPEGVQAREPEESEVRHPHLQGRPPQPRSGINPESAEE